MNSELSLWLNLKVIKKESYNSMLFCVDYYTQIQPGSTNLTFSPVVGWFSYINLQHEDNNACQFIKIQIPQGVTKLKIGICKWNQNAEIYVNDAFVKCISK